MIIDSLWMMVEWINWVSSVQGVRVITQLYAICALLNASVTTSVQPLCSSNGMLCSKTLRILLAVWALAPTPPPCVVKNSLLAPFNLELLLRGHISPLQPPWPLRSIKLSFAVLGWISTLGRLIEFYLDFIKHWDKPIKEAADCSHQHLIHHSVRGIKSDWH